MIKINFILYLFISVTAHASDQSIRDAIIALTSLDPTSKPLSPLRLVPDVEQEDEGAFSLDDGCENTGGPLDKCTKIIRSPRPSGDCGTSGTLKDRIANCSVSWNVEENGGQGGVWKLVTKNGEHEVWQDDRTKLLWSDKIGEKNWCISSGNTEDFYINCSKGESDSINPDGLSLCAEESDLTTPTSEAKAGLGLNSLSKISWRLPTLSDWKAAEVNGIRLVLPNMSHYFWSATVGSANRNLAWTFDGASGSLNQHNRDQSMSARCIGEAL